MSTKPRATTLPLPAGWGVTQLVFHFAAEDLSREAEPFAGTLVAQLRMDVGKSDDPTRVAAQDRSILQDSLPYFKLIADGESAAKMPQLEVEFRDDDGRTLRQLILYFRVDGHLYTVTGTHRAGPRFEAVRPGIHELAASLAR